MYMIGNITHSLARQLLIIIIIIINTLFTEGTKNSKNENRLCPLPYEEDLEDIIKTGWTEQCGHL